MHARYMQLFYSCLQENEPVVGPVGFTAIFERNFISYETLPLNALIPFDTVISNLGGHYNSDIYTFICPYHGVYMFSTSINNYGLNYNVGASICRQNQQLARGYSYYYYQSVTPVIITECESGDSVFVKVDQSGDFDASASPPHFTGYLLYRY